MALTLDFSRMTEPTVYGYRELEGPAAARARRRAAHRAAAAGPALAFLGDHSLGELLDVECRGRCPEWTRLTSRG